MPYTLYASLTDQYPCGAPDQIQIGTPQGGCPKNNLTCTAFSQYLFTDENTQAWCDNDNCAEPCTSPTLAPTMGPEEKAVYNMNQSLLPEQLAKEQGPPATETNIFQQFLGNISNLFGRLFLGYIVNEPKMYVQSENLDQSTAPQIIIPQTGNVGQNIQGYLGKNTGVYGVNLPQEIQQVNPTGKPIGQIEEAFEKANFPEGVKPITGQK